MGTDMIKRVDSKKRALFSLLCVASVLFSLCVHVLFLEKAKHWGIQGFSPESYDTIVPRTFRMKRVDIDPTILATATPSPQKNLNPEVPGALEKETPKIIENLADKGEKGILPKPQESKILLEKPEPIISTGQLEEFASKKSDDKPRTMQREMERIEKSNIGHGLEEAMKIPDLTLGEKGGGETPGTLGKSGYKQFSSIDDLLASNESVKKNTAPILMPTDLLFEYDSDALKPEAAEILAKLGSLIKKNAQAFFRIEGHTDSYGSDDYNTKLSLRRAEAVKNWLLMNMGLEASQISTTGLGKSRLLVPATGSVEQQQLNRRVEIVISTPK
ncbi:MAG: OmpA family protein [bacterium]